METDEIKTPQYYALMAQMLWYENYEKLKAESRKKGNYACWDLRCTKSRMPCHRVMDHGKGWIDYTKEFS